MLFHWLFQKIEVFLRPNQVKFQAKIVNAGLSSDGKFVVMLHVSSGDLYLLSGMKSTEKTVSVIIYGPDTTHKELMNGPSLEV